DVSRIRLQNIELVVSPDPQFRVIKIVDARLQRDSGNAFKLDASIETAGRLAAMTGTVTRDVKDGRVDAVTLGVALPDAVPGDSPTANGFETASISVSGTRVQAAHRMTLDARVGQLNMDLKDGDRIAGDVELKATMLDGTGKIEIEQLKVASGRSNWA